MSDQAVDRFALYYPYIHLRDSNWAKSTLLWFGQIRRIAPDGFELKDTKEIQELVNEVGPNGPLISSARLFDQEVLMAKQALAEKIMANLDVLRERFSQAVTPSKDQRVFEILRLKLLDSYQGIPLAQFLMNERLAWISRTSTDSDQWISMHPKLGSAVMSYLALAIARNEGLDIVTDSAALHETLIAHREMDVFDVLLGLNSTTSRVERDEELADDLGQLVLQTHFDVSILDAKALIKLLDARKDLQGFRQLVATVAASIPAGIGPEEKLERLQAKREEIFDEWRRQTSFLPPEITKTFREVGKEEAAKKILEGLPTLGTAVASHAFLAHVLGGIPGLTISVVVGTGIKMWKMEKSPLKFLSRVDSSISSGLRQKSASLYLPQWSSPAGLGGRRIG
jgi:hypothetical protein